MLLRSRYAMETVRVDATRKRRVCDFGCGKDNWVTRRVWVRDIAQGDDTEYNIQSNVRHFLLPPTALDPAWIGLHVGFAASAAAGAEAEGAEALPQSLQDLRFYPELLLLPRDCDGGQFGADQGQENVRQYAVTMGFSAAVYWVYLGISLPFLCKCVLVLFWRGKQSHNFLTLALHSATTRNATQRDTEPMLISRLFFFLFVIF